MKIGKGLLVGFAVYAMILAAKADDEAKAAGEDNENKPAVERVEKAKADFTDDDWDKIYNMAKSYPNQSDDSVQFEIGKTLFSDESSKAEARHKEAVEWLLKSADQGNTSALYLLGHCYYRGRGVGRDDALAYNYWRQAADDEGGKYYLDAVCVVGKCLLDGVGVAKDMESGVEWLREAADNGNPHAQYELAVSYFKGNLPGGQNIELGLHYLEKLAEKGYVNAEWLLGSILCNKQVGINRLEEGLKWILKAAGNGHMEAQAFLGNAYLFGENGVEVDNEVAFQWLGKAADQGDAFSALNFGVLLVNGTGCEKDAERGFKYLRKAMELGNEAAYNLVGCCYFNGIGVARDMDKAMEIYEKGAKEKNNADCQYHLSQCYSLRKECDLEFFWVKCAAEQGHSGALNNLGDCYEKGRGVAKDYGMALKYYRKALELEEPMAWCSLGECHEKGLGVVKDGKKAVELYEEAIRRKCPEAYMTLGRCYENGTGVEKDLAKAAELYRKGADEGIIDACRELIRCLEEGIGVEKNPEEANKWRKIIEEKESYFQKK